MANKHLVINEKLNKEVKAFAAQLGMGIKEFVELAITGLMSKYHQENKKEAQ